MFIKKIFVLITVAVLFSCADPSIFEDNGDDIAVYTVKSGGLQQLGTSIPVSLDYGKESPEFDTLEITLFSDSGLIILKETIPSASVESREKTYVNIPSDSGKGLYHIKIRLLKSGIPVKDELRSFFYDIDGYRIESVRSYPPDPVPGEKIILKADYSAPEDSDPWFKWTVDSETVSEGYASVNGNIAALDLLPSNGVVAVTVEMFPFKPSGSGFEDFISFFNTETAVFVSDKNRERGNELENNDNYSMLLHFRGEIQDSGFVSADYPDRVNISVEGSPDLDFKNSLYGYSFKREDSVTVTYESNPLWKRFSAPMTLRMRFLPDRSEIISGEDSLSDMPLFSAGNSSDFSMQIGLKDIYGFYINIDSLKGDFYSVCEYSPSRGSEVIDLAVSFYQGMNSTGIVWAVNGRTLKSEEIPFNLANVESSRLSLRIGGADMLVDEAGLYVRDEKIPSSDSSYYSSLMRNYYNGNYIASDGFDYSEKDVENGSGSCSYENGSLIINPGSSALVFKELDIADPSEIRTAGEAYLVIKNSSGSILFETAVSESSPVNFDPELYPGSGSFDLYLANNTRTETYSVDNILVTVKYPEESRFIGQ